MENTSYALITGASQGLGRAIAAELARRGISLILVALPDEHLKQTLDWLRLQFPDIDIQALGLDLTSEPDIRHLAEVCQAKKWPIRYLVNNAGMGFTGAYEQFSYDYYESVLRLNVMAVARLTRLLLPVLRCHQPAHILNIASMAALFQMPYKSIYSASKAFVRHFSLALREELSPLGVWVTVVCPGGMTTNPQVQATIGRLGFVGRMFSLSPETVARQAVVAMLRRKSSLVPGRLTSFYACLRYLLPAAWVRQLIAKVLRRKLSVTSVRS